MAAPLSFPQLMNARDLGGYPTTDGELTRTHSLVRADDLAQLTAEGLQALEAYGIRTVVDLRWPEESARDPNPVPKLLPHLRFEHVSLLTHTEDEWRLRSRDVAKELWKCVVLERVRLELRRVLSVIADASPGGAAVSLRGRQGPHRAHRSACCWRWPTWSRRRLRTTTRSVAQNLREGYLKRYANTDPARILEALRCPEEGAYNMLKFLDNAGGVRAYLREIGLSEAQIRALRARLRS